ncbi:Zn-dependent exopeptidase [Rickenella mellea]|uniref:Zn-dependent exopeptidase n=1 Tax=Rickenella mellea TaxID=50990 RepID=A0A4R5XGF0_9AGAM|nr:Zn-dependent exopeptidase [Rickenella mellea]
MIVDTPTTMKEPYPPPPLYDDQDQYEKFSKDSKVDPLIPAPATSPPQARRRVLSIKRILIAVLALGLWFTFVRVRRNVLGNAVEESLSWVIALDTGDNDVDEFHGHGHKGRHHHHHHEHHHHGHHHHKPPHHKPHHRRPHKCIINGRRAEEIFLAVPNNESAIATSRKFATKPHMAGTPGDFDTAVDFLALIQKELGISSNSHHHRCPHAPRDHDRGDEHREKHDHASEPLPIFQAGSRASRHATLSIPKLDRPAAWIDTYYPVLNSPGERSVEVLGEDGKVVWKADVEENSDAADPDAHKYVNAVPAFHGLSKGGDVQGRLVWANYGRKEDYDKLVERGVDFNGTIVIVRYGGIFRGLKVKGAQERGALGVLIYSDPLDDGTVTTSNGYAAYPHGPARNPSSVQRGSVQFISMYPGDPTTPGYPSYENATRTDGANIPRIPSLPISWNTAEALIKQVTEGGENTVVRLVNEVHDKVTPIWNVMGVIPGHIKDEVVVVGNHRDAWVLGATDPTSGTVSTYEVLRGLGQLLKKGWKPLRTIVIASWDAEEASIYGLIGSTEWGEDFPDFISKHVVAYLNLDSSVSGSRFGLSASPSLAHLVRGAAIDIAHPTKVNMTLWDARLDRGSLFGDSGEAAANRMEEMVMGGEVVLDDGLAKSDITGVGPLGSGSDYTVFLQRIGIASTNGGFQSTLSDPVYHYHSIFDSQTWQEKYGDPGFHRHVAVAKHLGLQLLRLADAIVLPLNTTQYAYDLDTYLSKVEDIASSANVDADFSALRSGIAKLQGASEALDAEKAAAEEELKKLMKKWWKRAGCRARFWRKVRAMKCRLRRKFRALARKVRRVVRKIKRRMGCGHRGGDEEEKAQLMMKAQPDHGPWKNQCGVEHPQGPPHHPHHRPHHPPPHPHHPRHHHGKPHRPPLGRKLLRAARRVQRVNQKLVSFERGFISSGGIKDREWYKHLGVAPGKWLGYGATTFPGLTEALTYEKNVTLAQYEAGRLQKVIEQLARELN